MLRLDASGVTREGEQSFPTTTSFVVQSDLQASAYTEIVELTLAVYKPVVTSALKHTLKQPF